MSERTSNPIVARLREELEKRAFHPGEHDITKDHDYCDFCNYSRDWIARHGHGDDCLLKEST